MHGIGPLRGAWRHWLRLKHGYFARLAGKKNMGEVDDMSLRVFGGDATLKLRGLSVDVVLAPHTNAVAYLQTRKPVVVWPDGTFAEMVNFSPDYCSLCAGSLRDGRTFPLEASADDYCRYVPDLMRNYSVYKDLARSSFNEFATRLNWHSAGAKVEELLAQL